MSTILTNRFLHRFDILVAICGIGLHRAIGNLKQRIGIAYGNDLIPCRRHQRFHRGFSGMWWMPRNDLIENSSQQIHIALGTQDIMLL